MLRQVPISTPSTFDDEQWLCEGVTRETPCCVQLPLDVVPAGYGKMEHVLDSNPVVPHRSHVWEQAQRGVSPTLRYLGEVEICEVAWPGWFNVVIWGQYRELVGTMEKSISPTSDYVQLAQLLIFGMAVRRPDKCGWAG